MMHYKRWRKHGDVQTVLKPPGRSPVYTGCRIEACDGKHASRGLCDKHYRRLLHNGDPEVVRSGPGILPPWWKGDDIGYYAAHYRVYAAHGAAAQYACACGQAAEEWAYDHSDSNEKWSDELKCAYSTDPDCYIAMCMSCHRKMDWDRSKKAKLSSARRES
jgi:hypothetical protein